MDPTIPEIEEVPSILLPCTKCQRTFRPEALAKHTKVCENILKKRKAFDSAKQRIQGTEIESYVGTPPPRHGARKGRGEGREYARARSREKVDLGKVIQAAKKPSTDITHVKPSEHEECPYCGRSFGPKAYDRHTEFCKEQHLKLQASPNVNQEAKERLKVRTTYKGPLTNKVMTTRDRYQPKRDPSPVSADLEPGARTRGLTRNSSLRSSLRVKGSENTPPPPVRSHTLSQISPTKSRRASTDQAAKIPSQVQKQGTPRLVRKEEPDRRKSAKSSPCNKAGSSEKTVSGETDRTIKIARSYTIMKLSPGCNKTIVDPKTMKSFDIVDVSDFSMLDHSQRPSEISEVDIRSNASSENISLIIEKNRSSMKEQGCRNSIFQSRLPILDRKNNIITAQLLDAESLKANDAKPPELDNVSNDESKDIVNFQVLEDNLSVLSGCDSFENENIYEVHQDKCNIEVVHSSVPTSSFEEEKSSVMPNGDDNTSAAVPACNLIEDNSDISKIMCLLHENKPHCTNESGLCQAVDVRNLILCPLDFSVFSNSNKEQINQCCDLPSTENYEHLVNSSCELLDKKCDRDATKSLCSGDINEETIHSNNNLRCTEYSENIWDLKKEEVGYQEVKMEKSNENNFESTKLETIENVPAAQMLNSIVLDGSEEDTNSIHDYFHLSKGHSDISHSVKSPVPQDRYDVRQEESLKENTLLSSSALQNQGVSDINTIFINDADKDSKIIFYDEVISFNGSPQDIDNSCKELQTQIFCDCETMTNTDTVHAGPKDPRSPVSREEQPFVTSPNQPTNSYIVESFSSKKLVPGQGSDTNPEDTNFVDSEFSTLDHSGVSKTQNVLLCNCATSESPYQKATSLRLVSEEDSRKFISSKTDAPSPKVDTFTDLVTDNLGNNLKKHRPNSFEHPAVKFPTLELVCVTTSEARIFETSVPNTILEMKKLNEKLDITSCEGLEFSREKNMPSSNKNADFIVLNNFTPSLCHLSNWDENSNHTIVEQNSYTSSLKRKDGFERNFLLKSSSDIIISRCDNIFAQDSCTPNIHRSFSCENFVMNDFSRDHKNTFLDAGSLENNFTNISVHLGVNSKIMNSKHSSDHNLAGSLTPAQLPLHHNENTESIQCKNDTREDKELHGNRLPTIEEFLCYSSGDLDRISEDSLARNSTDNESVESDSLCNEEPPKSPILFWNNQMLCYDHSNINSDNYLHERLKESDKAHKNSWPFAYIPEHGCCFGSSSNFCMTKDNFDSPPQYNTKDIYTKPGTITLVKGTSLPPLPLLKKVMKTEEVTITKKKTSRKRCENYQKELYDSETSSSTGNLKNKATYISQYSKTVEYIQLDNDFHTVETSIYELPNFDDLTFKRLQTPSLSSSLGSTPEPSRSASPYFTENKCTNLLKLPPIKNPQLTSPLRKTNEENTNSSPRSSGVPRFSIKSPYERYKHESSTHSSECWSRDRKLKQRHNEEPFSTFNPKQKNKNALSNSGVKDRFYSKLLSSLPSSWSGKNVAAKSKKPEIYIHEKPGKCENLSKSDSHIQKPLASSFTLKTTSLVDEPFPNSAQSRKRMNLTPTSGQSLAFSVRPLKNYREADKYNPYITAERQMLELSGGDGAIKIKSPTTTLPEIRGSSPLQSSPTSAFTKYSSPIRSTSTESLNKENNNPISPDGSKSEYFNMNNKANNFNLSSLSLCSVVSLDSVDYNRNPKLVNNRFDEFQRSFSAIEGKHRSGGRSKVNMQEMLYGAMVGDDQAVQSEESSNSDPGNLEACEQELLISMLEFEKMLKSSPIPSLHSSPTLCSSTPADVTSKANGNETDNRKYLKNLNQGSNDSAYSSLTRSSAAEGDHGTSEHPYFCHECGAKYPVAAAKFCCNCGMKRLVL